MLAVRLFREEQARDVMAVIADAAGFTLETALVDKLLATMRNEQGLISPVDIAITFLALNERAQARPEKTVGRADLALSGGATGLLADCIERQLDRYTDGERSLVYAMLLELAELRRVLRHLRQLDLGRNDGDKQAFIQASRRRRNLSRVAACFAALGVAAGLNWAFDTYQGAQVRQQLARWDLPRDLADGLGELVSVSIVNNRLENLNWLSGDP